MPTPCIASWLPICPNDAQTVAAQEPRTTGRNPYAPQVSHSFSGSSWFGTRISFNHFQSDRGDIAGLLEVYADDDMPFFAPITDRRIDGNQR